jgi:hypothetical protein
MSPEKERLARLMLEALSVVASLAVTVWALDSQLDGRLLGTLRPRIRWAWRCFGAAIASGLAHDDLVAGAEKETAESPWNPVWDRRGER